MVEITRTFEWDMGHRVTNHASLCRNPHGHRYKAEVTITSDLNTEHGGSQEGMVLDFGIFKSVVNATIVEHLDHSFMYWLEDDVMAAFALQQPNLRLIGVPFVPTAECIAAYIGDELIRRFKKNLPQGRLISVTVFETPNCKAIWRPDD